MYIFSMFQCLCSIFAGSKCVLCDVFWSQGLGVLVFASVQGLFGLQVVRSAWCVWIKAFPKATLGPRLYASELVTYYENQ